MPAHKSPHGSRKSDAQTYLQKRYIGKKRELQAMLEQERVNAAIAQIIYDLRVGAGLSQRDLAGRIGTTASVICRLEDADYEGHSLKTLMRVLLALGHGLELSTFRVGIAKRARTTIVTVPSRGRAKRSRAA